MEYDPRVTTGRIREYRELCERYVRVPTDDLQVSISKLEDEMCKEVWELQDAYRTVASEAEALTKLLVHKDSMIHYLLENLFRLYKRKRG